MESEFAANDRAARDAFRIDISRAVAGSRTRARYLIFDWQRAIRAAHGLLLSAAGAGRFPELVDDDDSNVPGDAAKASSGFVLLIL